MYLYILKSLFINRAKLLCDYIYWEKGGTYYSVSIRKMLRDYHA